MNEHETSADIIADMRGGPIPQHRHDRVLLCHYANRFEASYKREAQSIERIVRDAIIDYNEMYQSAPNDEAERDLRERAARANAWLKQHGFEEEPCYWSKEETPCL
jgi:hypothetical protein